MSLEKKAQTILGRFDRLSIGVKKLEHLLSLEFPGSATINGRGYLTVNRDNVLNGQQNDHDLKISGIDAYLKSIDLVSKRSLNASFEFWKMGDDAHSKATLFDNRHIPNYALENFIYQEISPNKEKSFRSFYDFKRFNGTVVSAHEPLPKNDLLKHLVLSVEDRYNQVAGFVKATNVVAEYDEQATEKMDPVQGVNEDIKWDLLAKNTPKKVEVEGVVASGNSSLVNGNETSGGRDDTGGTRREDGKQIANNGRNGTELSKKFFYKTMGAIGVGALSFLAVNSLDSCNDNGTNENAMIFEERIKIENTQLRGEVERLKIPKVCQTIVNLGYAELTDKHSSDLLASWLANEAYTEDGFLVGNESIPNNSFYAYLDARDRNTQGIAKRMLKRCPGINLQGSQVEKIHNAIDNIDLQGLSTGWVVLAKTDGEDYKTDIGKIEFGDSELTAIQQNERLSLLANYQGFKHCKMLGEGPAGEEEDTEFVFSVTGEWLRSEAYTEGGIKKIEGGREVDPAVNPGRHYVKFDSGSTPGSMYKQMISRCNGVEIKDRVKKLVISGYESQNWPAKSEEGKGKWFAIKGN